MPSRCICNPQQGGYRIVTAVSRLIVELQWSTSITVSAFFGFQTDIMTAVNGVGISFSESVGIELLFINLAIYIADGHIDMRYIGA